MLRRFRRLAFGLLLLIAGVPVASAGCGSWEEARDTSRYWFEGITYAPTLKTYIAVGRDGLIFRSLDGRRWSVLSGCTQSGLHRAIWANGRFVVVGEAGTVLTSADGKDWTAKTLLQIGKLNGVAGNNQKYVAVGADETILTSPDGINWTVVRGRKSGVELLGVKWLRDRFYAVGRRGTVLTSTDGQQWAVGGPGGDQHLVDIAVSDSLFVLATSDGHVFTSGDGAKWAWPTQGKEDAELWDLSAIASSGSLWLGVGYKGGLLRLSADAKTWESDQLEQGLWLRDVLWTGKEFVAVGKRGSVFSSHDGKAWKLLSGGGKPPKAQDPG